MAKKATKGGTKKSTSKGAKKKIARRAAQNATRKPPASRRSKAPQPELEEADDVEPPRPPDPRSEFLRLVSKIGAAEAQRLLDTFVEVETPRKPRP